MGPCEALVSNTSAGPTPRYGSTPDTARSVLLVRIRLGEDNAEGHLAVSQPVGTVDIHSLHKCGSHFTSLDGIIWERKKDKTIRPISPRYICTALSHLWG